MGENAEEAQQSIEEEYISTCLRGQIRWYSERSAECQKWYKRHKTAECILAVLIAPLSLFINDWPIVRVILPCMGAAIAFLGFNQNLRRFHENWILYRSACEQLKQELRLYSTSSGKYATSEKTPFNILVECCECIFATENNDWGNMHQIDVSVPNASNQPTSS